MRTKFGGDRAGAASGGWAAISVAVAFTLMPSHWSRGEDPPMAAELDRLVKPYIDESIVVGMVVGVIRGDASLVRGYGRVSQQETTRPDGKTVYEIGSITKTFTGLLLADAVLAGQAQLDQPVAELMPEEILMPEHPDGPIRLRHLATHVSGLPRMPDNMAPADPQDPYADYGAKDLYAFLGQHALTRGPVKQHEYSNLAFGLLGQLLANRAGKSYGELVRERIAEPLGMQDTSVEIHDSLRARLAPPYGAELTENRNWRFQAMAGAGALLSTADDMLRYAEAHLHPPAGRLGEAIELAWKTHQPGLPGQDMAMGLGWHIARDGVTRWHNGGTGGYHSMLLINRPAGVAVVVLANTATHEVDVIAEQLIRMLMGASEQPRRFPETVEVTAEQMQRLVGRYRLTPDFILTVKIEDDQLMVGATGQPFFRVYPQSASKWSYRVVEAALMFEGPEKEPAPAVVLHQNGLDQRAVRIE